MNNKVVLVTSTRYESENEPRARLAIRTCVAAREHGYQIVVVDDSPCPAFKALIRETGAVLVEQDDPGMGGSRRQAIRIGLDRGAKVIIWLEPEKHTLIPLLEPCITPVLEDRADVVIPRRRNLDNYPRYQQLSEFKGNWLMGTILGRADLDYYIGVRVMSVAAANLMVGYNPAYAQLGRKYGDRWEILFIPIVWYIHNDWRILSVAVDYVHPPEQSGEDSDEMNRKRDDQLIKLVEAVATEADFLGIRGF